MELLKIPSDVRVYPAPIWGWGAHITELGVTTEIGAELGYVWRPTRRRAIKAARKWLRRHSYWAHGFSVSWSRPTN